MFASLATLADHQLVDTGSRSGQGTFQVDASVHRCLPDRLGSSLGGSDGERPLGTPVGRRTHQCPGAQSNTPWPESTSSLYTGQACASTYGQSLSRLLRQSPGGHKISALPQDRPGTPLLGVPTPDLIKSSLYSWCAEPSSGSPLQVRTPSGGVEAACRGGRKFVGTLWRSPGGSLCIEGDDPLPNVVLPELSVQPAGAGCTVS